METQIPQENDDHQVDLGESEGAVEQPTVNSAAKRQAQVDSIQDQEADNVGTIEQNTINPALEKQAELEQRYKDVCAQEVALLEQLKQAQDHRKALATQLDLVRSLAS